MTPAEYKSAIKQLGLTQYQAALWLGVSERTGQKYAAKGPPKAVVMLLDLILQLRRLSVLP